jgi:uncharacterized protein YjbI with pentapeptide repeats
MSVWNQSDVEHVNFAGADLSYARYEDARGDDVNFSGARLDHACFHGSTLCRADYTNTSRQGLAPADPQLRAARERALAYPTQEETP